MCIACDGKTWPSSAHSLSAVPSRQEPQQSISPSGHEIQEVSFPTSPFSSSSSAECDTEMKAVVHAVSLLPSDDCSLGRSFRLVSML